MAGKEQATESNSQAVVRTSNASPSNKRNQNESVVVNVTYDEKKKDAHHTPPQLTQYGAVHAHMTTAFKNHNKREKYDMHNGNLPADMR